MALPENLMILTEPVVIGAAGLMYVVEFFADKVPGIDTGWDGLHNGFISKPSWLLFATNIHKFLFYLSKSNHFCLSAMFSS
jgi:hypothetical protein